MKEISATATEQLATRDSSSKEGRSGTGHLRRIWIATGALSLLYLSLSLIWAPRWYVEGEFLQGSLIWTLARSDAYGLVRVVCSAAILALMAAACYRVARSIATPRPMLETGASYGALLSILLMCSVLNNPLSLLAAALGCAGGVASGLFMMIYRGTPAETSTPGQWPGFWFGFIGILLLLGSATLVIDFLNLMLVGGS